MDGVKNLMRRHTALVVVVLAMVGVIELLGGEAGASAQCTAGGGVQTPGLCTISAAVTACPYALTLPAGENLLITSTGSIRCNGAGANGQAISITVTDGDMEMQSGSEITANSAGTNTTGGAITIAVPKGDFIMRGTGTAAPAAALTCEQVQGACISSSNTSGTGKGGTVKITVGNFPNNAGGGAVHDGAGQRGPGQ